jgi:flagellar assembly protein FliH
LLSCAVMKKMDLYKANVIKADEILDSGEPVSLSRVFTDGEGPDTNRPDDAIADLSPVVEKTEEEKLREEMEQNLSKVSDECYRKGFNEGIEFKKKEMLPALDAIAAITKAIPLIKKDILAKAEEQMVKLAVAIAEKILNQEVATRKDVVLNVLKSAMKNISETEGMKVRLNPHDFRYMMEAKKDFLQSFDGVRNVVFEEDVSIKRGGAVVETMFGEVDARLENQLKEIKKALMQA